TTLETKPATRASAAVSRRPVNMRSLARRLPSTRGSRWVAPTVPRIASGVPNAASGVATTKSHAAAISTPEPSAVHYGDRGHRQRLERVIRGEGLQPACAHLVDAHAGALLHVGAGAEHRAFAAHEYQPDSRVHLRSNSTQVLTHLVVERVARVGAVEGDGRYRAVDRIEHRHGGEVFPSSARIFRVCSPSAGGRPIS